MGLKGQYQEKNLATVLSAVTLLREQEFVLPFHIVQQGIARVVELTGLQGRWQVLQDHPLIICDTGHNEAGIRYVMQQLVRLSYRQLHIVFGMVSDKDHHKVLPLLPQEAIYYFTQAAIPRALDAHQLQQQAASLNLKGTAYPSVAEAVMAAKQAAATEDVIFIGGSSYVVAEVL
jgi:dihydrofolate synthase/folylpolyglutamate synthase